MLVNGLPALQVAAALLAIAALGLALGVPFPLAMRLVLRDRRARAYAWAVNGASSVLAAVLSTQVSLSFGHRFLFVLATVCYGVVWLVFRPRMR
jgi:predicted MFS family arabinose efflux permease